MKIPALIILAFSFAIFSCNEDKNKTGKTEVTTGDVNNPATATGTATSAEVPIISFREELHDFGKIKEGETVTHDFKFTNTGTAALIISNTQATCGCTVGEWPRQPIKPGESDIIKVTFNSDGKAGRNEKFVTITANTIPADTRVRIVAEVEPKAGGSAPSTPKH
jgi:hypothetical protein